MTTSHLDGCPRCGRAKRIGNKQCFRCNKADRELDTSVKVRNGSCHAGDHITPVPAAVIERVQAFYAIQGLARRIAAQSQQEAVAVEETDEDWVERKRYGVRASVACGCGRKLTVGVNCRCGKG